MTDASGNKVGHKKRDTVKDQAGPSGDIVETIRAFCERHGIAESTFGRLAVNDGKFVGRIAAGSRIEAETERRVTDFIAAADRGEVRLRGRPRRTKAHATAERMEALVSQETSIRTPGSFAFFEQRQRFHVFAATTNESWVLADRIAEDLTRLTPGPDGLRLFYAPMDNGIALARTLRALHAAFPDTPVLVVLKGRGLEDLRNTMGRLVDRLAEHPLSVFVMTNLYTREAVALRKMSQDSPHPLNWREVALTGDRSYDYQQQVAALYGDLSREWLIRQGDHGQPVYARPSVVTIFREDRRAALASLIPTEGRGPGAFDYALLNHPFLHSHTMPFRIGHVLAPVVDALAPGGQATVVQSHGHDPAHEIVAGVWPDQPIPFVSRHDIMAALARALGPRRGVYRLGGATDTGSLFRFDMHTLPVIEGQPIGALTLSAAWNNAVYFAEVKEELAQQAMREGERHLEVTADVLARHGGLWFVNETFSVTRKAEEER